MPTASINEPCFLIHNNVPIYYLYKNDWYDNGPYTYHYGIVPYPENDDIESFDIRALITFDKTLPIEEIIKNAIDEKALPLFQLPKENQKEYFFDDALEYISTTPQQDACHMLADSLLTKIYNGGIQDAFMLPGDNDFKKTLFLLPEIKDTQVTGHNLYVYHGNVSWNDLMEKEPDKHLVLNSISSELLPAVFYAMDVAYPCEKETMFIADDYIEVASDKDKETVEVYLWATDYLVNRAELYECGMRLPEDSEQMYETNFYGSLNVKDQTVKITGTYYENGMEGETQKEFTLPLYENEEVLLRDVIGKYCEKIVQLSPLELVNQYRKDENLSLISPQKEGLLNKISSVELTEGSEKKEFQNTEKTEPER